MLLLLLLLNQVFCGPITTETHIDFAATANADSSKLLTRVIKSAKVKYPLALNTNNVWAQFPDFAIIIDLPFSQSVSIRYNLSIYALDGGWLVTRVMIDGVEDENYRCLTQYVSGHNHFLMDNTWLSAGKHEIKVEYRMNKAASTLDMNSDYNAANFKVEYFLPPSSS